MIVINYRYEIIKALKKWASKFERGCSDALEEMKQLWVELEKEKRKGHVITPTGALLPSSSHIEVSPSMINLIMMETRVAPEIAKL